MPVMKAPDQDLEHIDFDAAFETKKAGGRVKVVEGYFAAYGNRDLQGDIMLKGCMKKSIEEAIPAAKVPLLDNHVYDVGHMVGLATEGSEDSKGFYCSHDVEETPAAQEVAQKVANGSVTKASIGFLTVQESWDQDVKGVITRTLHEVKLFENSVVLHPANEATQIWAKSTRYRGLPLAELDAPWDPEAAIARMRIHAQRKGGGTNWLRYAEAFLWRDAKKAEVPDGFAMPIADVIDGRVVVVPKGLLFAACALLGDETAGIPAEAVPIARKTVAAYVRRLVVGESSARAKPPAETPAKKSEPQAGPPDRAPTVETPLLDVDARLRKAALELAKHGD